MFVRWVPAALLALLLAPAGLLAQSAPATRQTEQVARRFYDAFSRGELATLERLYAPEVAFQDEIFSFSEREGVMGMWAVLLPQARVSWELLGVAGETATVRWEADYELFGRKVHNVITATLTVRGGQIVRHRDAFSWERWSRQALPLGGLPTWGPAERAIKAALRAAVGYQARKARQARPRGMTQALGE